VRARFALVLFAIRHERRSAFLQGLAGSGEAALQRALFHEPLGTRGRCSQLVPARFERGARACCGARIAGLDERLRVAHQRLELHLELVTCRPLLVMKLAAFDGQREAGGKLEALRVVDGPEGGPRRLGQLEFRRRLGSGQRFDLCAQPLPLAVLVLVCVFSLFLRRAAALGASDPRR